MKKEIIEYENLSFCMKNLVDEYGFGTIEIVENSIPIIRIIIEEIKEDKALNFAKKGIKYLNEKTGKNFKVVGQNLTLLKSLYKAKYDIIDVYDVIDKKVLQWKRKIDNRTGQNMSIYLRPKTLFNLQNFDSYVNEDSGNASSDANADWKG